MRRMTVLILMLISTALVPAIARAQRIALDIDTKELAAMAVETVEVTLDGQLLQLAARFLANEGDPDAARVAEMVRKLEGIYVRSYTFESDGAYDRVSIERFRARIGPGWQRIVNVRKANVENVEIYTNLKNDVIQGLVVIAMEPRELTLVNIVGPIDLADLSHLEGQFGIPRIPATAAKEE